MCAPPSSGGLKGQWGVSDPQSPAQNTGSDQQKQEFQAAFQKEQAAINDHLQYTSANGEATAHAGLASRRDALYGAFQAAVAKIDPKDAAKAQADIDQVLGDARALSTEAATLHQETEQAKQEWDSRQGSWDQVVHRVEELETWEDAQAPALRGQADAIRGQTNERRWREACTALEALLPVLEPVYQEYLRQRDAKPPYEQQSAEQSARLAPLKTAERPSQPMTAKATEADTALQEAKTKADAKDFVAAVDSMAKVTGLLDELTTLVNDPQRQSYLNATQGAVQMSEAQPEPAFKTLDADWAAIGEAGTKAQPLADAGDYAGANQSLADATTRRDDFQRKHDELVQQKQSYDAALAELQPRLQALASLQPPYAKLLVMQQELAPAQAAMASTAEADDFAKALAQLQDLSSKVAAIESAKADIDRAKLAYETALAALQPRLQAASSSEAQYAALQPLQQDLSTGQADMEAAAQAGDYDKASATLQGLDAKVAAIEAAKAEIDRKKQAYETALAALQPRLQAASTSEPQYSRLLPLQQAVAAAQSAMEAAAQASDYDKAGLLLQDLGGKLEAYEKARADLDQQRQAYDTLRTTIEARIDAASKKQYLNLAPKLEEIKKLQAQAAAAAQTGDYASATQQLNDAGTEADAYVTAGEKEVEPPIMGDTQNARADAVLKKLPAADQKEVKALLDGAKTEAEKQYLLKGVAAGHSVAELKEFDKKVQGKDDKWLRDNLSVTGSSTGTGVQQQWSHSCNATAAEAVKAQMDPLYALKLHEDNPKLDQVDKTDGTKVNPKLAADQKAALESTYAGGVTPAVGSKGVAVPVSGAGGAGRWADDLLNSQSDSTGITYATQRDPPVASAVSTIDAGVGKGQPVPIVIGNGAGDYRHYVVVTGMTKGPPKQYTIHDPGSGKTVVRTEAQLTAGALNLSGSNRITGIEAPTAKPLP